jgi:hypothetical protein
MDPNMECWDKKCVKFNHHTISSSTRSKLLWGVVKLGNLNRKLDNAAYNAAIKSIEEEVSMQVNEAKLQRYDIQELRLVGMEKRYMTKKKKKKKKRKKKSAIIIKVIVTVTSL